MFDQLQKYIFGAVAALITGLFAAMKLKDRKIAQLQAKVTETEINKQQAPLEAALTQEDANVQEAKAKLEAALTAAGLDPGAFVRAPSEEGKSNPGQ